MTFELDVMIYWNRKLLIDQKSHFDDVLLMPNVASDCLRVLETTMKKIIESKSKTITDETWNKLLGTVDIVFVIDDYEIIRTGTTNPKSMKLLPEMIAHVSTSFLRSFDKFLNNQPQDKDVKVIMSHRDLDKFDKDNPFGREFVN
jgi:hypothetical protein